MTEQLSLEDALAEAARRRDEGMARADGAASAEWKRDAEAFVRAYLRGHRELFVDDLWAAGLPHTVNDRALGPIFTRLAREGLMRKTGRFRKSVRSNLTEKPIWESLVVRRVAEGEDG